MQALTCRRLLTLAGVAGSLLAFAPVANANTIYIGLDDGSGLNQVAVGNPFVSYASTAYSPDFSQISVTADGIPHLGLHGIETSTSIDIASNIGGTLKLYVTETGVNAASPATFDSFFTVNNICSQCSATLSTYSDDSNNIFATTRLLSQATYTTDTAGDTLSSLSWAHANPFSVTSLYTLTLLPGGNFTGAITLSSPDLTNQSTTPLPAALPMFASALGGGFFFSKWRKRGKKAKPAAA